MLSTGTIGLIVLHGVVPPWITIPVGVGILLVGSYFSFAPSSDPARSPQPPPTTTSPAKRRRDSPPSYGSTSSSTREQIYERTSLRSRKVPRRHSDPDRSASSSVINTPPEPATHFDFPTKTHSTTPVVEESFPSNLDSNTSSWEPLPIFKVAPSSSPEEIAPISMQADTSAWAEEGENRSVVDEEPSPESPHRHSWTASPELPTGTLELAVEEPSRIVSNSSNTDTTEVEAVVTEAQVVPKEAEASEEQAPAPTVIDTTVVERPLVISPEEPSFDIFSPTRAEAKADAVSVHSEHMSTVPVQGYYIGVEGPAMLLPPTAEEHVQEEISTDEVENPFLDPPGAEPITSSPVTESPDNLPQQTKETPVSFPPSDNTPQSSNNETSEEPQETILPSSASISSSIRSTDTSSARPSNARGNSRLANMFSRQPSAKAVPQQEAPTRERTISLSRPSLPFRRSSKMVPAGTASVSSEADQSQPKPKAPQLAKLVSAMKLTRKPSLLSGKSRAGSSGDN